MRAFTVRYVKKVHGLYDVSDDKKMKHCQGLTLDTMNQNIVETFSPLGRNDAQIV